MNERYIVVTMPPSTSEPHLSLLVVDTEAKDGAYWGPVGRVVSRCGLNIDDARQIADALNLTAAVRERVQP